MRPSPIGCRNTRLLIALLAISGAGILLGLAVLAAGLVGPAYLLLFLVLQVPLLDVYNVHWATYVNGFYDIRAAKRIVPVLSTSARLAGIIAGLSMPLMNRLFSPAAIIGSRRCSAWRSWPPWRLPCRACCANSGPGPWLVRFRARALQGRP